MVGLEGPRRRATGDLLHHRCFHFKVTALVEEAAQRLEDLGALYKYGTAFEVAEQVDVTLAVAQLHVGQAMKFLGQGEHGLGEKGEPLDVHRQLAGAGAEEIAADTDVVAKIEQFVERERLVAHRVEPDIDLQALAPLLQGGKAGLALGANGHDAACDGHCDLVGFKVPGLGFTPFGTDSRDRVGSRELVRVSRLTQLLNLFQLCPAQVEQAALKL